MNGNTNNSSKKNIPVIAVAAVMFIAGIAAGYMLKPAAETQTAVTSAYTANPDYDYLAGAAAWQMSAEAHALMMQGFNIATGNIDRLAAMADSNQDGYRWVEENGQKKLYQNEKRVCVVCDIDDTLVDGVHYTANILGENGEWTNKAFTDFIQSAGCTALPGAVDFVNYCKDNGVAVFYVTNRYDQGYKLSEEGYAGQEGYKKADGTVIGSSTYDIFGKTMYDITMEAMETLGFPTNNPLSENYCEDVVLIVNDTKLNGSSKEGIRRSIAAGGTMNTGERDESTAFPATVDVDTHHIAMLLGDDLNDISQIFSDSENAVDRVELTVDNMGKWGTKWIVFPNAVYGSAANYAAQYGYLQLFSQFDYTVENNDTWEMYK